VLKTATCFGIGMQHETGPIVQKNASYRNLWVAAAQGGNVTVQTGPRQIA